MGISDGVKCLIAHVYVCMSTKSNINSQVLDYRHCAMCLCRLSVHFWVGKRAWGFFVRANDKEIS